MSEEGSGEEDGEEGLELSGFRPGGGGGQR